MANRSIPATGILAAFSLSMIPGLFGNEVASGATRGDADASTGILTDRLTQKQLQTWRSIEQIVQAVDRGGRPIHPRLQSLWQWARTSGHTIYIEMPTEIGPYAYTAGLSTVQPPKGKETARIAVIRLWCSVINRATVLDKYRRPDGLLPFDRLGKLERFAEVLGHELAHTALQLEDPVYARLCRELEMEVAAFLSSRRQAAKGSLYDQSLKDRMSRIESLTEQIEKPAQAAEAQIWRELLDGQSFRASAK